MEATSPWPARVGAWLDERFPPVVYTVLVVLFHVSAVSVAGRLGGGGAWAPAAGVAVWLFFLHLRIFDEHKDFASDRVAYPERVLSRGIVTLPLLARIGVAAVVVQAAVAAALGWAALVAWGAAFLYSVAMRYEFGVGRWLQEHLVLYAVTHNPVVAGLALFLHAASGAAWSDAYLGYVAMASVGSLAFEVGRKTRRPDEEHPGVASYTSALGQGPARALLGGLLVATGACAGAVGLSLGASAGVAVASGLGVALPGLLTVTGGAKRVEAGASVTLLSSFVVTGGLAWM